MRERKSDSTKNKEYYIKTDHLGNEYPSMAAMLRHYGIGYTAFLYRIKKMGMSLEEALTSPHNEHKSTAMTCKDHEGCTFPSIKAMCDHWRIPRTTFFRRRRDGWDLERCLTTPVQTMGKKSVTKDHLGQEFRSVDEMCKHHGITKKQYMINIRNGCSLKDALTTVTENPVIENKSHKGKCKDHLGNEYPSINAMCRAYGIDKTVLRSRIELGWTLQEILERPEKVQQWSEETDHLGNKYKCRKDMLQAYGVSEMTFKHRQSKGLSLEECLSPKSLHEVECTDHLGNRFRSIKDMLLYWNCRTGSYHHRRDIGWSVEKSLTYIKLPRKEFYPGVRILSIINDNFYEILINNEKVIWSKKTLFENYRKTCLPNEGRDLIRKDTENNV